MRPFVPLIVHKAYVDCQLIFLNPFFLLFNQHGGRERSQMKVYREVQSFPSNSGLKLYVRQYFNEHSLNTVQYSVEKQHVSILCILHSRGQSSCRLPRLRAVSKGLNAPCLTFDPVVCEKSKSKVRPKNFAAPGPGEFFFLDALST